MRFRDLALLACVTLGAAACTTTYVPLQYKPDPAPAGIVSDTPLIAVGVFADARGGGHGADWLGAIRGGYGNPLKKLRTQRAMQTVVAEAFADGLRARGVFAQPGQGKFLLEGTIVKLDCSEYFNLEAHAHVDVRVLDALTRAQVYYSPYRVDETEAGMGAGIFASVETLRALAERALREVVDRALDDPALRTAVQGQ